MAFNYGVMTYQVETYLKSLGPISLVFTMDGEGEFWALACTGGTYDPYAPLYAWSQSEAAIFFDRPSPYEEVQQLVSMDGTVSYSIPKKPYSPFSLESAWNLAQSWGGFMANPLASDCPVKVDWEYWISYGDPESNSRNVRFKLIGLD